MTTVGANLASVLLSDAEHAPDRPAVVADHLRVSLGAVTTYTAAASAWLADQGVRPGDVVALGLPDGPGWIAAFLGTVRMGAVAALVGDSLGPERAQSLVDRSGARIVLTDRTDLRAARAASGISFAAGMAAGLPDPGVHPVAPTDPCYMLATSGSTGPSKWVVHAHGDIPACIATYGRRVLKMVPGDVTWSVAALATSYGLGNSLYFPLGAGAAAWVGGGRDPSSAATACREGGVTAMFGVPTFWARLARHVRDGRVDSRDFASVRLSVSAGEHLPDTVWRAVEHETGMRLVNGLGSSEATNLYLSDRAGAPRAGTIGWPVPGYDMRVGESERPIPGDEGELSVRGPTVMSGYLDDPDATARAMADGWLRTGDLVRRETDGSYRFLGRNGDVFKAGALWIDPLRVQEVLLEDPEVQDAVAIGASDDDAVTRLVAVVAAPGARAEVLVPRLQALCRSRLEAHAIPRVIHVTDGLPAAPSGKVRRDAVREMAEHALRAKGTR